MRRRLILEPVEVLREFYANAHIDLELPESSLNVERLAFDLETMQSTTHFQSPVLALAGQYDRIVPIQLMRTQFTNLVTHPLADHSLGLKYFDWVRKTHS